MTRVAYVFMIKRPVDKFEWPAVYGVTDNAEELAQAAFGRCSPVITVDFDAEVATPEQRTEMAKAVAELRGTYDTARVMEAGYANPLAAPCEALLDLVDALLEGRVRL